MQSNIQPREIACAEAREKGIVTHHTEMPNGEMRYRLRCSDGTAYIRTEATATSGWQKSHFHARVRETYIVQKGRMALVELLNDVLIVRLLEKDGLVTTQPPIPHNVYLFPYTVIHTIKHGEEGDKEDRIPYPPLDELLIGMGETEILERATQS